MIGNNNARRTGHEEKNYFHHTSKPPDSQVLREKLLGALPPIPTTNLKRESNKSYCGPCPKCGGDDRFVLKDNRQFLCRHCHQEQGSLIDFHLWMEGLSFSDLCKKYGVSGNGNKKQALGEIKAVYDYTGLDGQILFQVLRYEPKTFRQRRPDGKGGYVWNLKGVEPVLYHLPEVLKADEVIVTEGEKDADVLRSLGYTATTAPMGAGKWCDSYNQAFKGKDVIILPDNDEPGRDHADKIARSLSGIASTVKIVSLPGLPEKGDVSDWIGQKKFVGIPYSDIAEKLSLIMESAETFNLEAKPEKSGFSFVHISDIKIKQPDWLIKGLVEKDSLSVFFGDPGAGKSFLGIDFACCVGTETAFHGKPVKNPGAVFYIAGEGQNGLKRRFRAWEIRNQVDLSEHPIFLSKTSASLTDEKSAVAVADAMAATKFKQFAPSLVVIDTLARNFGDGHENDTKDMNNFIRGLDIIRERFKCAVLSIHHSGLADKNRGRGASPLKGALDAEFKVYKDLDGIVRLEATKAKEHAKPDPMAFYIQTVELDLLDDDGDSVTSAILDQTEYKPPPTKPKAMGKNQVTALEVLNRLYREHRSNLERGGYNPDNAKVKVDDWQEACKGKDLQRNRFSECKKGLLKAGFIKDEHGYIVLLNCPSD